MSLRSSAVILLCLVFASSVFGQTNAAGRDLILNSGVKPHAGIDKIYADFSEAYRMFDWQKVTNLYTDNAFYLTPESGVDRGRHLIESNFKKFFLSIKEGGGKIAISFQIIERKVVDDLGYDVGIYTLTTTSAIGEATTSNGKFVVIALKQKAGDWRFQLDSYSDLPKEKK